MSRLKKSIQKEAQSKKLVDLAKHIRDSANSLAEATNIWETLSETEEDVANEAYAQTGIQLSLDDLRDKLYDLSDEIKEKQ
jgi:hypothetical protein